MFPPARITSGFHWTNSAARALSRFISPAPARRSMTIFFSLDIAEVVQTRDERRTERSRSRRVKVRKAEREHADAQNFTRRLGVGHRRGEYSDGERENAQTNSNERQRFTPRSAKAIFHSTLLGHGA